MLGKQNDEETVAGTSPSAAHQKERDAADFERQLEQHKPQVATTEDKTDQCPPSDGIWAEVSIDIEVRPSGKEYDRVHAKMSIAATNSTDRAIPLREPYRLPARNVFTVSARTQSNDVLRATASKSEICVRFDDRERTIQPNERFKWTVEYVRMAEVYFEEMLAYDIFIDPQQEFQGAPVRKHQFTIGVNLHRPEDEKRRWLWLKRWRIHQRNSLRLNPKPINSNAGSTYNFDTFDLLDEPFHLNIAAAYRFRSWIAHAFQLAVGAVSIVVIEHAPTWLEQLSAWLKAWRGP
jgi:hypothetical protein